MKVITQEKTWKIEAYSDSDWESDSDERKSITGWEIFVCGSLVGWGSRGQKCVTLSSTASEYVALSETCKKLLFIGELLKFMGVNIDYTIIVHVDNMGGLFMAVNGPGKQTKHIDTRFHFILDYIEK